MRRISLLGSNKEDSPHRKLRAEVFTFQMVHVRANKQLVEGMPLTMLPGTKVVKDGLLLSHWEFFSVSAGALQILYVLLSDV